jgi:small subunit ribosomal protein S4
MSRYTGPKEKLERRLGERVGLKGERGLGPKHALVKRPYPPGQHGPGRRPRKLSEYGTQLKSKQKVRRMYGLNEKPLKRYVKTALASAKKDSPYASVVRALETRLDNVAYRMGIAQSRDQARQLVGHGHVTLNGKRAKTPSIVVHVGDVIGVRELSKKSPFFSTLMPRWMATYTAPLWLELDKEKLVATVKATPAAEESGIQAGDLQAIIEFYSR